MFETVVVVDWSARRRAAPAKPSRDAIWWCSSRDAQPRYCRTREQAEEQIGEELSRARGRVLAGFDFNFALPRWAMERLGGWERLWRELEQGSNEDWVEAAGGLNRRLTDEARGPFWGGRLCLKKPRPYEWEEWRVTELAQVRRPKSVFQLAGAGSVGAQTLTGVPVLERLRRRLKASVWPFEETGERVVLAEVWPSVLGRCPDWEEIPDRWQVCEMVRALKGVRPGEPPEIAKEEGWILTRQR